MKLHPEDPRLTAYVLGELGPEDAAAVEQAAAADPAIQAEISEIRAIQRLLGNRLATGPDQLLQSQRENVRRSARDAEGPGRVLLFSALKEKLQSWLIPMCAAAVLAIATIILFVMPQPPEKPQAASPKPSEAPVTPALPAQGPAAPGAQPAAAGAIVAPDPELPTLVRRGSVKAAEFPTLDLPVQAGKASMEWVRKSILVDGKMPPGNAVRPEEILNHFPFRLSGTTSIARARDLPGDHVTAPVSTLSTEVIACPWKPSSILLLISVRGNPDKDCDIRLSYQSNPGNVFSYRLIGFPPVAGTTTVGQLPTRLPANSATVLALEIEPSKPGTELGMLVWTVDGKPAPAITLQHKSDAEPSNDARFAALVCTFSQWLAGEQSGSIDGDIVSALAREIASSDLAPDRSEFLNLIDRSLNL
ncbi:MAG: hypothetical protein EOP85_11225 [Verrucomicrobiaceae bacterium]|nr:MAG: hypothetical protein EOP85_11225 [Verrucomicrobiaceae bacterium]